MRIHACWYVMMHVPVKFTIILCICQYAVIESLNTINSCLVFLDCLINLSVVIGEVFTVLSFNFLKLLVHTSKPLNNFIFIEVKAESWTGCSMILLQSQDLEAEHTHDRVPSRLEIFLHEAPNLWYR